ncbi:MAG: adenylyl-sulfate kinase [Nitrospira sp.]|nr:adenylyl-sulfate kinase [Nitrospira sp.]
MAVERMKAQTIWLTGLPCAGKTTLATLLFRSLLEQGVTNVEVLDGDVVRTHLSKGLGFSRADRDTNIRRIGWVCRVLTKHGVCSIVAAVSPFRAVRDDVRAMVEEVGGPGSFVEVWVRCGVEECIRRDVKGMWRQSPGEKSSSSRGLGPYEEPLKADVVVNTGTETPWSR